MVLVDTSIWVEHLRHGVADLVHLLEQESVCCHQFVVGELACGNLSKRDEILALLQALPDIAPVEHHEYLHFIQKNNHRCIHS